MSDREFNGVMILAGVVVLAEALTFMAGGLMAVCVMAAIAELVMRQVENRRAIRVRNDDRSDR